MKKFTLVLLVFLSACREYEDDPACANYKFISIEELRTSISIESPRPMQNPAKIYRYQNLLLVNEPYKGVHLLDNTDPKNPVAKAFIAVLGNLDMALKDGYLYLDSFVDLVVIDVNDLDNIREVERKKDVFRYEKYQNIATDTRYLLESECQYSDAYGFVVER